MNLKLSLKTALLWGFLSSLCLAQVGPGGYTPRSCINVTDGSNTVSCTSKLTVSGGTVSGSNPNATLTITGGTGSPGGTNPQIQYNNNGSFGGITRSGVDSNGNIGIGTTATTNAIQVGGNIYMSLNSSTLYMQSPNGNCWSFSIDNIGHGEVNPVACPTSSSGNVMTFNGNIMTFNGQTMTF